MGMKKFFFLGATVTLLLFWTTMANSTPVKDKVAVLILSWGAPAGACLDYAWQSHQTCRIGDRTLYPGQPCKFGHVGEFPYQIHIGILPWALTCLWEDTVITIGQQVDPSSMKKAQPVGPAVHFGPYRTMFNRDVTIRLPYNKAGVAPETLKVYIYNHLTNDWDSIEPESVDGTNRLVTFKTNVLGLFRVGVEK
jgi:hypothetical protein